MPAGFDRQHFESAKRFGADVISALSAACDEKALQTVVADIGHDMGFQHWALFSHEDHRIPRPGRVAVLAYPQAITDRIIDQGHYRRDPVMRGCNRAARAFIWSELGGLIDMDRRDRSTLEFGARHGLSEGITIPCKRFGHCVGSTTFAGNLSTERVEKLRGIVDMIGVLAFQQARVVAGEPLIKEPRPRLNQRSRDCIILFARGLSNKLIARALGVTPRTVEGYLREAFRLFNAKTRAELLARALLAGEIGAHELG